MRWFRRMFVWFGSLFRRRSSRAPSPKAARPPGRRIGLEGLENRQLPSVFTVTNTNDSGNGSLRAAITNVDDGSGGDTIAFSIGKGAQTIQVHSALPSILVSTTIDGTSQPGYVSHPPGTLDQPLINLDGSLAGVGVDGLDVTGSGVSILGLDITNFSGSGIALIGSANDSIIQNYIGINLAGDTAAGNGGAGITLISGAQNNNVSANVISGNGFPGKHSGIDIEGSGTILNVISGNNIGTNAAGTAAIPNADHGIALFSGANNNQIGGNFNYAGNLISGNDQFGVELFGSASRNLIEGNRIGTDVTGTQALGNQLIGVHLTDSASFNTIGGSEGGGNTIAFNGKGVVVEQAGTVGNSILGNSIFGNNGLGIDLGNDGVTVNLPGGSGSGPNDLQSYPVLTAVSGSAFSPTVSGTLTGTPSGTSSISEGGGTEYEVDFFANDPNGPARQGQTFLGSQFVVPDSTGVANFTFFSPSNLNGTVVTATATNLSTGNTSEFSAGPPAHFTAAAPTSQSAAVGTAFASPLTTILTDAYNEPLPGFVVGLLAPEVGAGGTFAGGDTVEALVTDANGAVTPVFTANTVPGTYAVTEYFSSVGTVTFTLTNTPGAAQSLVLQNIPPTVAGVSQAFTVTAFDQFGNVATGYRGTLDFTSSDPQAALPAPYTFTAADNGQHTFNVTLKTAGTQSIALSDGTLAVSQSGIAVSPAAMSGFVVSAPTAVAQGSSFGLTVRAVDAFGNTVPTYSGTVQFSSSDAFAVLAAPQPFSGGVQTFANVGSLATPGVQTIAVTDSALPAIAGAATLTVNNVPPSDLTLTPSTTTLQIGDSLTLNGSFTDPGRGDTHTVSINWDDGTPATMLTLGASVLTFQANHVFVQGLPAGAGIGTASIAVTVSDASATTSTTTAVSLTDVPPVVTLSAQVAVVNVGSPLNATGSFVSPGMDPFVATVNFGDGTGQQNLPFNPDHTFSLSHTYGREGSFTVTVSVNDGHNNVGVASLLANVLLAGINTPSASVAGTNGGTTATAATTGISATLTTGAPADSFIIVSVVPIDVARNLVPASSLPANTVLDSSYDIRAVNVNDRDSATVTFSYSASDPNPVLDFVDTDGMLKPVQGSSDPTKGVTYFVNAANHTITVVFDSTSKPAITAFQGTVFAVSVGAPAPAVAFPTSNPTGNANGTLIALAVEPSSPSVVADVGPTFTVSAEPTALAAPGPAAESNSTAAGGGDGATAPVPLPKDDPLADLPPPPAALPAAAPPVILAPSQLDLGVPPDAKPLPPPPPSEELQESAAHAHGPDVVLHSTDCQPTATSVAITPDSDAELALYDEPAIRSRPALSLPGLGGVVLVWYHQGERSSPAARRPPRHAPPSRRQRARK